MRVEIPENIRVLAFLQCNGGQAAVIPPDRSTVDPYRELGSHPDVVERVWDGLGQLFGPLSRQIVCGTPGLVHPETGVVLALAFGTQYVIKIGPRLVNRALGEGYKVTNRWSDGTMTDLQVEIGKGWFFGRWSEKESAWLDESWSMPPVGQSG